MEVTVLLGGLLLVGILAGLVYFLAFKKHLSISSTKKSIVLIGLSGSGKTSLFHRLISGNAVKTHTSMIVTNGTIPNIGPIADTPGENRLLRLALNLLPSALAIVFTIDATTADVEHLRAVTPLLYDVLCFAKLHPDVPVAIAVTKTDRRALAARPAKITAGLEAEMSVFLRNKRAALGSGSATVSALGHKNDTGQDVFTFEDDAPICWLSTSAVVESGTTELKAWLQSVCTR